MLDDAIVRNAVGLLLVYAIIAVSLVLYLVISKKNLPLDGRKVVHIGVGNFIFVWWLFSESWIMLVFFTVPFAILLFMAMFDNNPVGKSKLGQISGEGHKPGLFFYAISITVLVIVFWIGDHILAASLAVVGMTYGDGFGSIIGKKYGKHKTIHGKSVEGAIAVFVATFVVSAIVIAFYAFLFTNGYYSSNVLNTVLVPWWVLALVAALIASATETLCDGDYDNLAIPILIVGAMIALGL